MSFFGRMFEGIFHHPHHEQVLEPPSIDDLQAELAELARAIRDKAVALENGETPDTRFEREHRLEIEQRQQARKCLEAAIMSMHARLGTGLDHDQSKRLAEFVKSHRPVASAKLEAEVDQAVMGHLYFKVGELAWSHLGELIAANGLEWELSSELLHGRDPSDVKALKAQKTEEMRLEFLDMTPQETAEMMVGEVKVWSTLYPDPGTWLWKETVLQGVGSALRAGLYEQVLLLWEKRPEQLDSLLQQMMTRKLSEASAALRNGIHSLSEANKILADLRQCCRNE
ncbi:MAG: hypothetical protein KC910_26780, partial [Candidatus Eremiobacteraeota bacterium]|nr:hypothetical protein [Candidatus Eremiobacteraeota bacterium]